MYMNLYLQQEHITSGIEREGEIAREVEQEEVE